MLIFFASLLLALGPYLQVGGVNSSTTDHPIPMPFLFFRMLPFMAIFRFPSRFVGLAMLALAVLAAIGADWLSRQPGVRRLPARGQAALPALLAVLVLFEFWPRPFPLDPTTNAPDVSPFYRQLAADPEDYAILEMPNLKADAMFYQTIHEKRIFGGRIAREKLHDWRKYRFFGALIEARPPVKDIGADESPNAARAALICQGVRYVVFYKQNLDAAHARRQRGPPEGAVRGQPAGLRGRYPAGLSAGRHAHRRGASGRPRATGTTPRSPRRIRSSAGSRATPARSRSTPAAHQRSRSASTSAHSRRPRTLQVRQNGAELGSFALPKDTLTSIEVPLSLQPGENQVVLHSVEPAISPRRPSAAREISARSAYRSPTCRSCPASGLTP